MFENAVRIPAVHTVIWSHPVLGEGRYEAKGFSARDVAEECADIFAGQPVLIRVWVGRYTKVISTKHHYEIDNG